MKTLLFANTDWYLLNFREPLLQALRARGDELALLSAPGPYGEQLVRRGYPWRAFALSRSGANLLYELNTLRRLHALYRQINSDLFVHFTIKCVIYGSIAAKLLRKRGIVNSIDGLGYVFNDQHLKSRFLRLLILPLYRAALKDTLVIFLNPDDRDTFLALKLVKPGQFALVPGVGIDLDAYSVVRQDTPLPVVLFAGRLLYSKGVAVFVEAARRLKAEGVAARFVLVGRDDPGNPESVTRQTLDLWVAEGIVEDWGWRDDMPAVYQEAHVMCLPAISREGLPKSLMEAGASGIPVVASDVTGCRDIVRDGENGLLAPPNDAARLAEALRTLVQDAALRDRMGQRGRELVEQNFSAGEIVRQILQSIDCFLQHRQT